MKDNIFGVFGYDFKKKCYVKKQKFQSWMKMDIGLFIKDKIVALTL